MDVYLNEDTGAEANVIPLSVYRKIAEYSIVRLNSPTASITAYNGEPVPIKVYKGQTHDLYFYISEVLSEAMLSIEHVKDLTSSSSYTK